MRKLVACLVGLVMLAGLGVSAYAVEPIGISPMYLNASSVKVTLTFDGTTAKCSSTIQGLSGTTNVTATFSLWRKNTDGTYTPLSTWANQSVSGTTLRFSETYAITKGYTYRFVYTAHITRNKATETINGWVENTP